MEKVQYVNPPAKAEFVKQIGYSEGVRAGNLLYTAGQVGLDENNKVVKGGLKEQTRQAFKNLKAVIEEAGGRMENIVHLMVFLADKNSGKTLAQDFEPYFEVKNEFLPNSNPAATGVRIKELFYPELLIEIQAVAAL